MHIVHSPELPAAETIDFADFLKVDIRVGTVIKAHAFPKARNPSYLLHVDFGAGIGLKKSAAQINVHYSLDDLVGRQVMAVVNFPQRQIGPIRSEVLILGFPDADGAIVLAAPEKTLPNGARLA